jgi:hypothetical protein
VIKQTGRDVSVETPGSGDAEFPSPGGRGIRLFAAWCLCDLALKTSLIGLGDSKDGRFLAFLRQAQDRLLGMTGGVSF